jgi:hypothetical protein
MLQEVARSSISFQARGVVVRSAVAPSLVALFVAALGLSTAPRARGQDGGFTPNERDALGRGELVTRPRRETRSERLWVGGTSYQRVERPRAEVWRGVRDVGHWHDMLPETSETRPERGIGEQQLVGIRHSYGPIDARYTLRVDFDDTTHRATFEVDGSRHHDVRGAHGFIEVHAWPGDTARSLLVWAVLADPGDNPLVSMILGDIQYWSLRVPTTMRGFLQGAGASLYRE